jgi:hypothetical protein
MPIEVPSREAMRIASQNKNRFVVVCRPLSSGSRLNKVRHVGKLVSKVQKCVYRTINDGVLVLGLDEATQLWEKKEVSAPRSQPTTRANRSRWFRNARL